MKLIKSIKSILILAVLLPVLFASGAEIERERTFFSKTFDMGNSRYNTILSTIPIHYRDGNGNLMEITGDNAEALIELAYNQIAAERVDIANIGDDSYSEYKYQEMVVQDTTYYSEEDSSWHYESDTTYSDTTGYSHYGYARISTDIWSTAPNGSTPSSEIWRGLLSWNISNGSIPNGATINTVGLIINLHSVVIPSNTPFPVQIKSMGNNTIDTTPEQSDWSLIENSSLVTEFDVEIYSYGYLYDYQYPNQTDGVLFDGVSNNYQNNANIYTLGFKHSSENFDDYTTQDSPNTTINSGQLIIEYTLPEIELFNRLLSDNASNLGDTLSLNQLAGTDDYYNQPSGSIVPIHFGENYTIWTHKEWLTESTNDVKHYSWNINSGYNTKNVSFDMLPAFTSLDAQFKEAEPVTINSSVDIDFHDPWYLQNPNAAPEDWIQPDAFRPLSDQDDGSGNVQVFLNQNENFSEDYPIYSLKAPQLYATTDGIYEFDEWTSNGSVDFGGGATTTTQNETDVVFLSAGATVTAQYNQVNNQSVMIVIPPSETLTIPSAANIEMVTGFKILVKGELNLNGTTASPINLFAVNGQQWDGIVLDEQCTSPVSITHTNISNCETALTINKLAFNEILIDNFVVDNSTNAIYIPSGFHLGQSLDISNSTFNIISN